MCVSLLNIKQLPRERILLKDRVGTESDLFDLVARTAGERDAALERRIRDRLARRHARRPVGLGSGLALPHAAVPGLTGTRAVFVRSAVPIPTASVDGHGITEALALLVPMPGLASDYDLLMGLISLLTRPAARDALRKARTTSEIQAFFIGEVQV